MISPYLFTATVLAAADDGLPVWLMFALFMLAFFGVIVALIRRGRENIPGTRESARRRLAKAHEDDMIDDYRKRLQNQRERDDPPRP